MKEGSESNKQQEEMNSSYYKNDLSKKSTAPGDTIPIDQSINHYELPNLTHLLYDFTNMEKDVIERCFRVGNYNALRELPDQIKANRIN